MNRITSNVLRLYRNTTIKIEHRVNDNKYRDNRHDHCLTGVEYIHQYIQMMTAHLPLFSSSSGIGETTCSLTCDPRRRWRSGTRPF